MVRFSNADVSNWYRRYLLIPEEIIDNHLIDFLENQANNAASKLLELLDSFNITKES